MDIDSLDTKTRVALSDRVANNLESHPILGAFLKDDLRADKHEIWELAYALLFIKQTDVDDPEPNSV